jgi:hypothetical protein
MGSSRSACSTSSRECSVRRRDRDGSTRLTCVDPTRQTRWNGRSTRRRPRRRTSADHDTRQDTAARFLAWDFGPTLSPSSPEATVMAPPKSPHSTVDDIDRGPRSAPLRAPAQDQRRCRRCRRRRRRLVVARFNHSSYSYSARLRLWTWASKVHRKCLYCITNQSLHFRLDTILLFYCSCGPTLSLLFSDHYSTSNSYVLLQLSTTISHTLCEVETRPIPLAGGTNLGRWCILRPSAFDFDLLCTYTDG